MANLTRSLLRTSVALAALCLTASCEWPAKNSPQEYFESGSVGADLIPLPVFLVLPDMFPENFQPAGQTGGDWIDQFGFVRRNCPDAAPYCLPYGLTVTRHSPQSGSYSMIPYVGMTCALCHTGEIRVPGSKRGVVISGMGNAALDLVAFGDAVRSSALDQRLSVRNIDAAYKKKYGNSVGVVQRVLIRLWLAGFRKDIRNKLPMVGSPFHGPDLRNADFIPSGPGRIMAARDAIVRLKNEMPHPDGGPSKLPNLYMQSRRDWAQFDGSVRNPLTRNSIAALGVGATIRNLRNPDILATIRQSYEYVRERTGPRYTDFLPPVDQIRVDRGREVYKARCATCHGQPAVSGNDWIAGPLLGQPIPAAEIGTDDARVTPRYYDELACLIYAEYPDGHPLKPKREELRTTHGYITTPLESVFSRAPYLHNGSIATLAELINLKPRRNLFYRGREYFDVADVGLLVSSTPDPQRYYRFDTSVRGNSNRGHDYPWPYGSPDRDENQLRELLEYLKTL